MAKHTITVNFDKFTAQIVNSKRSTLGKRGITGGVEVDFSKIPDEIKTNLLIDAVRNYLQVGLKSINQETATTEDCQAAMRARLSLLESGAVSAPGSARKAPTRDPVVAAAKLSIKKAIQDRTEEKLDGKVLTKMVSELFKTYNVWVKAGKPTEGQKGLQGLKMIEAALEQAKAAIEAQAKMSESLAGLADKASKLSQAAKAAKEAAEGAEAEAEAAPAPTKPKGKAR